MIGMRALMVPRLLGSSVCATDDDGTLFEPLADLEQFLAKAIRLRREIGARGIGHAAAVSLGLTFSERDGMSGPELYSRGLGRAKSNRECEQVKWVVTEWADGDSIVAHYGYGIDLFCSEDFAKGALGPSVLDPKHRKWLNDEFGIQFMRLAELADKVMA
jgi:hypothetical protein